MGVVDASALPAVVVAFVAILIAGPIAVALLLVGRSRRRRDHSLLEFLQHPD